MATARFTGVSLSFQEPNPTTAALQASFGGLLLLIRPRTLFLTVVRWDLATKTYQPVVGMGFVVLLESNAVALVSNAAGKASVDFPDLVIFVSPQAGTVPGGYTYTETVRIDTQAKTYLTITLIPDSLPRYRTAWQLL